MIGFVSLKAAMRISDIGGNIQKVERLLLCLQTASPQGKYIMKMQGSQFTVISAAD